MMRIALTGVPGTGKTAVAAALARQGVSVVHLNELAAHRGLLTEKDVARDAWVVDLDALNDAIPPAQGTQVVEGHFAHEMDADLTILLRVDPAVLLQRLRSRGWSDEKVRENVEAEALDVLASEVLDIGGPSAEIDASRLTVEETASLVLAIAEGRPEALKGRAVGTAAWSLEALPWFSSDTAPTGTKG
jgi:adenylate kinase